LPKGSNYDRAKYIENKDLLPELPQLSKLSLTIIELATQAGGD
jgi:hypothetical protein